MQARIAKDIHFAAVKGDLSLVTTLLQQNISVDLLDKNYRTPLHSAIIWEKELIVDKLLAMKATVNVQDNFKMTPLMYACRKNQFNVAKKLIEHKADVNLSNLINKTALYECRNYLGLTILLIKNGAEIHEDEYDALFKFIQEYAQKEWEEQIKHSADMTMILEKYYEKLLTHSETTDISLLLNFTQTYLAKLQKIAEIPELVWESISAFPLKNGKVPLDVTNLSMTYVGFFSGKYKIETERHDEKVYEVSQSYFWGNLVRLPQK